MKRLAHIDWMRGLACVLMFQTHCYDSWLSPEARKSPLFAWSQLGGTLPAPLFIFLSGISFALVTEKLREKGAPRNEITKTTIRRGGEIFGLALLFRVQEFALGYPWSPWTDLLRVDVLNILGLSMILMGLLCWISASAKSTMGDAGSSAGTTNVVTRLRNNAIVAGLFAAALVALLTPPLWTTHRPKFLPWPLESYINGVHIFDKPQPWLFPLFPWSGFAFAGLAVGFFLFSGVAKRKQELMFFALGGTGILACALSVLFDSSPIRLYAAYDYWHSSPNFFLMRCGMLLGICAARLQPHHPARQHFVADLLGAHRICVRKILDSAEAAVQRAEGQRGFADNFSRDGAAIAGSNEAEETAGYRFDGEVRSGWSACGILMMTSPRLARPRSSRAIFSMG